VESGVEAGHLSDAGQCCGGRIDACEIVGLMAGARGLSSAMAGCECPVDNHRASNRSRRREQCDDRHPLLTGMGQDDLVDQSRQHLGMTLIRVLPNFFFSPDRRFESWRLPPCPIASIRPEKLRSSPRVNTANLIEDEPQLSASRFLPELSVIWIASFPVGAGGAGCLADAIVVRLWA
jgi:hypothetical protein